MGNFSKQDIKNALWERGVLKWKCEQAEYNGRIVRHHVQCEMYDLFYGSDPNSTLTWLLSRQTGKTYFLGIIALEQVNRKPGSIVKALTDTKLHLESIFIPVINNLLEDCPEHLKPKYDKNKFVFTFPNGSQIQLAGTDNGHYERLRGSVCDLVLIDEAGFCENLDYIVKSVLIPTTTHTGGKIVLASTPSKDPDHEFLNFVEESELNGTLVRKTIYDNPLLSEAQIQNLINKMGGADSADFKREYLCQVIKDESKSVFPEFTDDLQAKVVKEWDRPPYYDAYVGMDLGGSRDLTAVLFMYYDFANDKIIVEDEIIMTPKSMVLPDLVKGILNKEEELWFNFLTNEQQKPHMRVSDLNHLVTQEIHRSSDYQLIFNPAKKDDKDMAINNLRVLIAQEKIIINPRCVNLIRHLANCKWRKSKNKILEFARSPDNGHYDCVDALLYATRAINFRRNPYPVGYNINLRSQDAFFNNRSAYSNHTSVSSYAEVFKKAFSSKKN